jgi:methionyl-tRNA formyltransferase
LVTAPPARAGRGLAAAENELASAALAHGLPVLRPQRANEPGFIQHFARLQPDLAVVVAYGQILPREFLEVPRLGCVNLHGSLLPRWRGASPVQAAILAGDAVTGVCVQQVVEALDAGAVLARRATPIRSEEDAPQLSARLAALGADLLREFLDGLDEGVATLPQGEEQAPERVTRCRKIRKEHSALDWSRPAAEIGRFVRAMAGWPVARTALSGGETLLVHRGSALDLAHVAEPGSVLRADSDLVVACGGGAFSLEEVQREGRARLPAREFLRGAQVRVGDRFGGYPGAAPVRA